MDSDGVGWMCLVRTDVFGHCDRLPLQLELTIQSLFLQTKGSLKYGQVISNDRTDFTCFLSIA